MIRHLCVGNMTTMVNKVDDFFYAFPNKVIKHTGRPNYETLKNIKQALKRNFAMVPFTLGGGNHRYLGAVLTAEEYAAATPINTPPFANPHFPGAAAIIPPNSTGPQIGYRMTIQQSTLPMDGIQEPHQCWQKIHPKCHR